MRLRLAWMTGALLAAGCSGRVAAIGEGMQGSAGESSESSVVRGSSTQSRGSTISLASSSGGHGGKSSFDAGPSDAAGFTQRDAGQTDANGSMSAVTTYVDAGLYRGDGSFFVDSGRAVTGQHDAAMQSVDASPGCGPLAACCGTLPTSEQSLCQAIATGGSAANCATELTQLEGAGQCSGVNVLASQIQVSPSRLISDGVTLFFTDYLDSAGLQAVPVQGGPVTTLMTGIVHLIGVDDLNVYVMVASRLNSIGAGSVDTLYMVNASLLRVPKSGARASLIGTAGGKWAATTLDRTIYWVEGDGPVVQSASLAAGAPRTVGSLSGPYFTDVAQGLLQIGVTSTTVFVAGYNAVHSFSISGTDTHHAAIGIRCESFASDTSAVYCDVGTGNNVRIQSNGTTSTLGPVLNPEGTDRYPYIVFDDTYAYWADDTAVGTIMKAPKAGGGTAVVLARDTSPTAIAVDAHSVYWSDLGGYIKSVPK